MTIAMASAAAPREPASDLGSTSPNSLNSFVGQEHVVAAVRVALDASRHDQTRFPHSLFVGPPGLGKSNLVQIIAHELGVELKETLAQTLVQTTDLAALLLEVENRQIVFIDEADELEPARQTLLYRALSEGKLFLPRGPTGSHRGPPFIPLEGFTLILASNHESRLARPLVERFKMLCRFEFYTAEQILRLLQDRTHALSWNCEEQVLDLISSRSRGVPRIALRLLESVHRTARSEGARILTAAHFEQMCHIEGIDAGGLDRTERSYLRLLRTERKALRLNVIADRLGLPPRTVSGVIESFLVRERLIERLDDGRRITTLGDQHLYNVEQHAAAALS